jgi:hypothetical protein
MSHFLDTPKRKHQMTHRTLLLGLIFSLATFTSAHAQKNGIGTVKNYDAEAGGTSGQLTISDFVMISIDTTKLDGFPTADVLTGDALRRVAVVQDGTTYVAYFVADKVGSSTLKFSYTIKGTSNIALTTYSFAVSLQAPGRTLFISPGTGGAGVTVVDSATKQAPADGIRVGDILRTQVSTDNISLYGASVFSGTAVSKASSVTFTDSTGKSYYQTFFSANMPGTADISYSFRMGTSGDGGAIMRITVNQ